MEIKLAVRDFIEFIMNRGSIDNRHHGNVDRAVLGTRIHRKLQKQGGKNYQAEVFFSHEEKVGEFVFIMEGRADGVIYKDDHVIIDEIKTTEIPLASLDENFNPLHFAQAMCYGYFHCAKSGHEEVIIQVRYYHLHTEKIKTIQNNYQKEELQQFYQDLLQQYVKWAKFQVEWTKLRNDSIKEINFPFNEYRLGQRELAVATYKTILGRGKLFSQAPTGTGKTISTLFPTIKSFAEKEAEKFFYLTAKTITRQAAEDAVRKMRKQGLNLKTVTFTAKDKVCFLAERNCNPEVCPYANGYYDRVNDAVFEILQINDSFTRVEIEQYAKAYQLCPFELALDLSWWCDGIICDYNYLFDPQVYLKRFFSDNKGEYVFLIDEAHNLVDRSREMFSATICKSTFLMLKKQFGKGHKGMTSVLDEVNKVFVGYRKQCEETGFLVEKEAQRELNEVLLAFTQECKEWLQEYAHLESSGDVLQLYVDCRTFLKIAEFYNEQYVTFIQKQGKEVVVKQLCLNPSELLNQGMKRGKASVLFSATFSPIDYYVSVLGGDEETRTYSLPSPFPVENALVLIGNYIQTTYYKRESSCLPIARAVMALVQARVGNYLVFFPSFKYLNDVYDVFCEEYPDVATIVQGAQMDEEEREVFLGEFQSDNEASLVGFCVMGGIFSEGIDLVGDRLIGVAIVGVGLPQINRERDLIKEYYGQKVGTGYQFAYQFPGMNKVMQAAGRVIRSEDDKGVILLLDARFGRNDYLGLFPEHWWGRMYIRNIVELELRVKAFWEYWKELGR